MRKKRGKTKAKKSGVKRHGRSPSNKSKKSKVSKLIKLSKSSKKTRRTKAKIRKN